MIGLMNTTPLMLTYQTRLIGFTQTREQWLNRLVEEMKPMFAALKHPLPDRIRVAIAWTSMGKRSNRIGECWDNQCSADRHFEIFIRGDMAYSVDLMPMEIAAVLAHELCHAACGIASKHGPKFGRVARGLGLTGKMTSTVPGPNFLTAIEPLLIAVGPLPHGRLNTGGLSTRASKQTPRWKKLTCGECGYIVRTTQSWINDVGFPLCPDHGAMLPDGIEGLRKAA